MSATAAARRAPRPVASRSGFGSARPEVAPGSPSRRANCHPAPFVRGGTRRSTATPRSPQPGPTWDCTRSSWSPPATGWRACASPRTWPATPPTCWPRCAPRRSAPTPPGEAVSDHGHAHSHAAEEPEHATHVHGVAVAHNRDALRVVAISSLVLAVVAALELSAAALSHSAAVLADGLHNLGDVSTTVALAAAFILSRRAPNRRFPYGYHRSEDLAGLVVLGLIIASAVASGVTSIEHLVHPEPPLNFPLALAVALVGFAGNEAVAQYKTAAGRRMGSMALVADGRHSRLDGLVSLGAAVGVLGALLGAPVLDPVAGLALTAVIAVVAWET